MLWALDEKTTSSLTVRFPYFERAGPLEFDENSTYVTLADDKVFESTKELVWNHGLGETMQALLDEGVSITGLAEHMSIPWEALPGQMVEMGHGESSVPVG